MIKLRFGLLLLFVLLESGVKAQENPGIVEISAQTLSQFTRIVALSDVHGMYKNAMPLLQAAGVVSPQGHWAGGKTLVIITGDSIDKGPQSLEVLALWMRLQEEAPQQQGRLVVLLGNHEAELLADPVGDKKTVATQEELTPLGLTVTELAEGSSEKPILGQPLRRYSAFLHSLPLAARVGNWLFCHAGWVPAGTSLPTPQARWQAMVAQEKHALARGSYSALLHADGNEFLERKDFPTGTKWWRNPDAVRELETRLESYGLSGVVFGHSPTAFDIIGGIGYSRPEDHRLIKIDSGMAPESGGYAGSLLLFPQPTELAGTRAATVHALVGKAVAGALVTAPLQHS